MVNVGPEIGEKAVLSQLRDGSYEAFEYIYHRYKVRLAASMLRLLKSTDLVDDLLQELFVELWDKRQVFPLGGLSLPWLKKRLWYKLVAHFRTQGFKQRHLENFRVFAEQERLIDQPKASSNLELESQYEVIMDAIALTVAQMPARMQEVFLLNREQQFTINEIAQRLDLSPNTVRNHLQAAMKHLRKSLKAQNLSTTCVALLWWVILG